MEDTPNTPPQPLYKRLEILIPAALGFITLIFAISVYFSNSESSLAPKEKLSVCAEKYEQLLAANQYDFSVRCTASAFRNSSFNPLETKVNLLDLAIVFDVSGSMAGSVSEGIKIEVAKKAIDTFLTQYDKSTEINLSVIVYGHAGDNSEANKLVSCGQTKEIFPLGSIDRTAIMNNIAQYSPTGWTPIAKSLQTAATILAKSSNETKAILLISDGEETCGGNPVAVAQNLNETQNIRTSVIGFDVAGTERTELEAIARAGGGDFTSAKNQVEIANAILTVTKRLDALDFKIGRSLEQIYDAAHLINTHGQCKSMLERERAAMMLDIYTSGYIEPVCTNEAEEIYTKRYTTLLQTIDQNFQAGQLEFENIIETTR